MPIERAATMKPILFNTEMAKAILDGRKTVTRRIIKPQPPEPTAYFYKFLDDGNARFGWKNSNGLCDRMPPYQPGDILYVRETWARIGNDVDRIWFDNDRQLYDGMYIYRADGIDLSDIGRWHPAIHMPKDAARIYLRVTAIKAERVQDISDRDLIREGETPIIHVDESLDREATRMSFLGTWNSTIKPKDLELYGWNANPWVWVIRFERVEKGK